MIPLAQLAAAAAVAAGGARAVPPAPADSARPRVAAPDRWLGADKAKHFFMAGFVESAAFAAARMAGAGRRPALGVALGVAAGASIGKEHFDLTGRGKPSLRDLAWDAAGMAAYGALLARTPR